MFRLQFAYNVAPSWFGVARRQWLGRNGSGTGNVCIHFLARSHFERNMAHFDSRI